MLQSLLVVRARSQNPSYARSVGMPPCPGASETEIPPMQIHIPARGMCESGPAVGAFEPQPPAYRPFSGSQRRLCSACCARCGAARLTWISSHGAGIGLLRWSPSAAHAHVRFTLLAVLSLDRLDVNDFVVVCTASGTCCSVHTPSVCFGATSEDVQGLHSHGPLFFCLLKPWPCLFPYSCLRAAS